MAAGDSLRTITSRLGRAVSTISREVARNGGRHRYRAHRADRAAWQRARRPQSCKLATNPALRAEVEDKLAIRWSPQQISGWLHHTYPDIEEMQVSHETIYLTLFIQAVPQVIQAGGSIGGHRSRSTRPANITLRWR